MQVLDHGYLRLVETWGSDERVIESARMSTDGAFRGWEKDERLLKYLYDHKHMTPFEMCGLTIEVQAPIFVFREWHRHRTQSYNELSGRYTELPELYYVPSLIRLMNGGQSKTNKQGAGAEIDLDLADETQSDFEDAGMFAFARYNRMLACGISRELASRVLPLTTYSRMRASANLRNWLAFLTLRDDPAAQYEIQTYAKTLGTLIAGAFPRTWGLFDNARRR